MARFIPQMRLWGPLAALVAIAVLSGGCATKRDLNVALHQINTIKREQAKQLEQMRGQIESRSGQLEIGQTESRAEADGIRSEIARMGSMLNSLQQELTAVSQRVKTLQNNQAIGLGSLSGRVDDSREKLQDSIATQADSMDQFATRIAGQVDNQGTQVAALKKSQKQLAAKTSRNDKSLAEVSKTLNALGKKLAKELKAHSKRIDAASGGGASSADLTALNKQVKFLGDKLPKQVDKNSKANASLATEIREYQSLLGDLNKRLKALEAR